MTNWLKYQAGSIHFPPGDFKAERTVYIDPDAVLSVEAHAHSPSATVICLGHNHYYCVGRSPEEVMADVISARAR